MPKNVDYKDIGESASSIEAPSENKKYYPSISLDLNTFPELKEATVGKTVELTFLGEISSLSISESKSEARIELKKGSVYAIHGEEKDEEEKKEKSNDVFDLEEEKKEQEIKEEDIPVKAAKEVFDEKRLEDKKTGSKKDVKTIEDAIKKAIEEEKKVIMMD